MNPLNSYPSIYQIGHKAVSQLLMNPVYVQEKIDGSQFSFQLGEDGEIRCRSKGAILNLIAPEKMFTEAVNTVLELKPLLHPGWTYRGEYLKKPKHNALIYDRVPNKHIILFDITTDIETYLPYAEVVKEAERIGLECVQKLFEGMIDNVDKFRELLNTSSVLGGQKIEGVVIKPIGYGIYGVDKKCLMAKYVSEAFKEIHQGEWKKANPSSNDILQELILRYRSIARWQKAIQHLTESGVIEQSPKDIGHLLKEVAIDVHKECESEIKELLWKFAWPKISRGIIAGLPEWYKEELLKKQFEGNESHE